MNARSSGRHFLNEQVSEDVQVGRPRSSAYRADDEFIPSAIESGQTNWPEGHQYTLANAAPVSGAAGGSATTSFPNQRAGIPSGARIYAHGSPRTSQTAETDQAALDAVPFHPSTTRKPAPTKPKRIGRVAATIITVIAGIAALAVTLALCAFLYGKINPLDRLAAIGTSGTVGRQEAVGTSGTQGTTAGTTAAVPSGGGVVGSSGNSVGSVIAGGSGSVGGVGNSGSASGGNIVGSTGASPQALESYARERTTLLQERRSIAPLLLEQTVRRVTLSAVGDNLIHMPVVYEADANFGDFDDGYYDFTPMYAGVQDIVSSHDLNFIDQETILGGDYLGLSGYPTFNSPSCIASQVAGYGWNLVTTATNHSFDYGLEAILNSCATWGEQTSVVETGTFSSWEDRQTIRTFEHGGIRFAFLSYTDYLNGYVLSGDIAYAIATADEEAIVNDITRAHELADVIIVGMSWGEEDSFIPNDYQRYLAQLFANLGVDIVLGFGPHVIQPIEWFQGYDSNGNPTGSSTLVVFSLGNFLSNQPKAIECIEGCFTCTFEQVGDGEIQLKNLMWTPLICHVGAWHQVYKLKDYGYDLAWQHQSLSLESDPIAFARQVTTDVIGPSGVHINM